MQSRLESLLKKIKSQQILCYLPRAIYNSLVSVTSRLKKVNYGRKWHRTNYAFRPRTLSLLKSLFLVISAQGNSRRECSSRLRKSMALVEIQITEESHGEEQSPRTDILHTIFRPIDRSNRRTFTWNLRQREVNQLSFR